MAIKIEIEKGIPIKNVDRRNAYHKYPWMEMEIGDSFLAKKLRIFSIASSRRNAERKTGFKFACRTVDGGTRIWRVR